MRVFKTNIFFIETPAMPQLSTIPANSVFPNLPAPSPHIRSLYSAFHAARVAEDSRNSQSKDVLENHVAGSNINNNINNIMLSAQSHLLADFFRKMLEDFLSNMANTETPLLEAKVKTLELENERLKEDLQKTITKAGEFVLTHL